MQKITVNASRKYDVIIGKGLLENVADYVKTVRKDCKACIITDKNVNGLYSSTIENSLTNGGISYVKFVIDGGEESKSGMVYLQACEFLAQNAFTRSDVIIALGGGIVGDLAGFISATYLRGVNFLQVPTTLLACVDSSVGGKTAINLKSGKNLVGAFYQPTLVLCDINCLKTLSCEEYACGMAEVIKYAMIFDDGLLAMLEGGMDSNEEKIIAKCVDLKRKVVESDERDNGERQLLNFGHTLGHAIEKESDFKYVHGQAVAMGMSIITEKAIEKGLCDKNVAEVLNSLLVNYNLKKTCDIPIEKLVNTSMIDKKRKGDTITVVLPKSVGKCSLVKMKTSEWEKFIQE